MVRKNLSLAFFPLNLKALQLYYTPNDQQFKLTLFAKTTLTLPYYCMARVNDSTNIMHNPCHTFMISQCSMM